MMRAVVSSQTSERAIQSPNEHMRSVPLALAYAQARGESSRPAMSSTKHAFFIFSVSGSPTAAPAGLTCLKEAAAGSPRASLSSRTSCHEFSASRKFMYPGLPLRTSSGSSAPPSMKILAGFWLGLQPYLSSNSFIVRFTFCFYLFSILLFLESP